MTAVPYRNNATTQQENKVFPEIAMVLILTIITIIIVAIIVIVKS